MKPIESAHCTRDMEIPIHNTAKMPASESRKAPPETRQPVAIKAIMEGWLQSRYNEIGRFSMRAK